MSLFKVAGVSTLNGVTKVRFANDFVSRVKMLIKSGHTDIELIELAEPLTKAGVVAYLKTTDLMQTARYAEAINLSDEKYNTVRVTKPAISLEAIRARVGIVA
jgi:hypothetical protein